MAYDPRSDWAREDFEAASICASEVAPYAAWTPAALEVAIQAIAEFAFAKAPQVDPSLFSVIDAMRREVAAR